MTPPGVARKPARTAWILVSAATGAMLAGGGTVFAQIPPGICKIADPTGTPLNIHLYPGGPATGRIANGMKVKVREFQKDRNGHTWAHIYLPYGLRIGWFDKEYLVCRD